MTRHRQFIRALLGLCMVILAHGAGMAQTGAAFAELFEQAQVAYQQGDFAEAVAAYSALVEGGVSSAAVYQNLGSAYYQQGEIGYALVNYLRADRLDPRYRPLDALIARVRAERIDRLAGEAALIDALGTVTEPHLALGELVWMCLALWVLLWGIFGQMLAGERWQVRLRGIALIVSCAAGVLFAALALRIYVTDQRPPAVVVTLSATVMSGPGEGYLPLYTLYTGAEMRLLATDTGWARFVLADGRHGWIAQEQIEQVDR